MKESERKELVRVYGNAKQKALGAQDKRLRQLIKHRTSASPRNQIRVKLASKWALEVIGAALAREKNGTDFKLPA